MMIRTDLFLNPMDALITININHSYCTFELYQRFTESITKLCV